MKQELEAFTTAHQIECNTCKSEDPAAAAKAEETGYWLPWVGDPPPLLAPRVAPDDAGAITPREM